LRYERLSSSLFQRPLSVFEKSPDSFACAMIVPYIFIVIRRWLTWRQQDGHARDIRQATHVACPAEIRKPARLIELRVIQRYVRR
jgi:hypothetical protein